MANVLGSGPTSLNSVTSAINSRRGSGATSSASSSSGVSTGPPTSPRGANTPAGIAAKESGSLVPVLKIGLLNSASRFLTAEAFGFKLNASSKVMKKQQIWTIFADPITPDIFYLQSHLKRFLSIDKNGRVTCEKELIPPSTGSQETAAALGLSPDEQLAIEYHTSGNGQWALKSVHGTYLGGVEDQLLAQGRIASQAVVQASISAKEKGQAPAQAASAGGDAFAWSWWTPIVGVHPHVHLRHLTRNKFATLRADELQCTEWKPWGANTVVTLEQIVGKVAIRASDGRYLQHNGQLCASSSGSPGPACLFGLEVRSAGAASGCLLRAESGSYLTVSGTRHSLKAGVPAGGPAPKVSVSSLPAAAGTGTGPTGASGRTSTGGKEDVFVVVSSVVQMAFKSCLNGKLISCKQAGDMIANQSELGDTELFQFEFQASSSSSPASGADTTAQNAGGKWRILTFSDKIWRPSVESGNASGIQAAAPDPFKSDAQELFALEYQPSSRVCVRLPAGQMVCIKKSGALSASTSIAAPAPPTNGANPPPPSNAAPAPEPEAPEKNPRAIFAALDKKDKEKDKEKEKDKDLANGVQALSIGQQTQTGGTNELEFWLQLGNRPVLILRSEFGYLGVRPDSKGSKLEGNLTNYYSWVPVLTSNNAYLLKSQEEGRGQWRIDDSDKDKPVKLEPEGSPSCEEFYLELRGPNQFAIRSVRLGHYLRAEQNGLVRVDTPTLPTTLSKLAGLLFEF